MLIPSSLARNAARLRRVRGVGWALLSGLLAGCDGPQSSLAPAGRGAEQIADLFWWMFSGAVIISIVVIGLGIYSVRVPPGPPGRRAGFFIIGGGAVVPTVVLAGLLVFGLAMLPDLSSPAPEGSLKISVIGEQWWWRVKYDSADGEPITLANEIRLPVGEPVEFHLESADVIHSFWIPSLGGKVDMIPGRQTRLKLEPTRTGVFRGACAEYCGGSHALMLFFVVVTEKKDFEDWLAQQAQSATSPTEPLAVRGERAFIASGCGACHTVRGTAAKGVLGPDLTHVGGRMSLGAGTLPNETHDFLRWIADTETIKPEVHMPSFGMLSRDDLLALAAYLDSLE
jgi:cytochrome c oxidase subunit 2